MFREENKNLRYVIYARRSIEQRLGDDEEARGVPSINSQLAEVHKYIAGQGLNVVKEFTETKSASKPYNRPEFEAMIEYIKAGKADGILCFKIDRLARNSVDEGIIKHYLQTGVVKNIKSTDRDWYSDDHTLVWAVEFGTSTQYSRDLIKHIKRGQNQATERGFRPSIAPIGYRNSKYREDGQSEEILVDEERFQILRKMFDLILTGGYTPHEVHKIATEDWGMRTRPTRRFPVPKPLSVSSWYNILSNPFYCGEFEYPRGSGKWFKGNHKPLISRDEYEAIQVILGRAAPRPKVLEHKYTGHLKCGECGRMLTCVKKTKKQKNGNVHHYSYYYCTGIARKGCKQGSYTEKEIEKQIIEFLSSLSISAEFHQWALAELKKEHERERGDRTCIVNNQQAEYKSVTQRLESLFQMRLNQEIDAEMYTVKKSELEVEQRRLKASLDSIDARMANWYENAERLMTFAQRAVEEFEKGDLKKKKVILAALGHVHIARDRAIHLQTEKPLQVLQEVVLYLNKDGKLLEPAECVGNKGYSKKFWVLDTKLWRWGELNPRPS
jgi:DNA invertase Pin-like site-specific DNA recombinase